MPVSNDTNLSPSFTASEASRPAAPALAMNALEKLMGAITAHVPKESFRIGFDIPRAVALTMAAQSRLASLRPTVVQYAPMMDMNYYDQLSDYASAAWYAHLAAMPKSTSTIDALKAECWELRLDMLSSADPLVRKGYFSAASVDAIRAGSGNLDTANDVVALSALFASKWNLIQNKTPVEWSQVQRAAVAGPELIVALGEKLGFGNTPSEASKLRLKAASLFKVVYDEVDRVLHYVRWYEDDVRAYLPGLFEGGRPSGRAARERTRCLSVLGRSRASRKPP